MICLIDGREIKELKLFAKVLVGLLVVLGFSAVKLVCIFYWCVLRKAIRDAENRSVTFCDMSCDERVS